MSMKNSIHTIGNRTRDLTTRSAVPQPTAPLRATNFSKYHFKIILGDFNAKFPCAKISCKSSRLDFWGSRRHPHHRLSSKGSNYQRGVQVLLLSAGATAGHFEGKTSREVYQRSLVLARQRPGSPGTCSLEETGLLDFQCFDHPSYSTDLAPSDYNLFPGLKNN